MINVNKTIMITHREIVIDIETVPIDDLELYKQKFPKKPNARSYKPDKAALYWTTGQVCCIGLKWQDDDEITICTGDEYDTLKEAHEILKGYNDQYVSFNGIDFDFKFIVGRAWKHLIPIRLPTNRYAKNHHDIYNILGGNYGSSKASLAELAYHFGVDDEYWGNGAQVEEWWQAKEWDKICKHNRGDIISTYRIWHGYIKNMYRQF